MGSTQIYAVAGAKGGVGKTTTSINLGTALALDGRETVVVELDLAMANLADFLAIDCDPERDTTLHDVLAGQAAVADAIYATPTELDVVPSGTTLELFAEIDLDLLPDVIDRLRDDYETIVLDTGAGVSRETIEPLKLADETLLVTTPRVAAVRDVDKTATLVDRVDGDVRGVILTCSGSGNSPGPEYIASFLDVELLGHVPESDAVPESQDRGIPAVVGNSASEVAITYRNIVDRLLGAKPPLGASGDAGREEAAHGEPGESDEQEPQQSGVAVR